MNTDKPKRKNLYTPANIAAAAFNIPVMVIAGTIIGVFLANEQESPLSEIIIIFTILLFFIISILELYYIARNPVIKSKKESIRGYYLRQIIKENSD
ncbi:MAG: hypothetical protein EAX86_01495 [Candidatus Heimdallarchaeota archaeon]|nr:hypothetical protein [Candidatus Heimdallarchaeota archaeon]